MRLKSQFYNQDGLGYADFFPYRQKVRIFELAEIKSTDVLYDFGCGDASILIFAVKQFGLKKAVGYETSQKRYNIAIERVRKAGLARRITIKKEDYYEADIENADVIFDMLPESLQDYEKLYSKQIRDGTRLIKHDLPLIGFIPDKINYPFYRMTFPLVKAATKNQWAAKVLGRNKATPRDVWHELFYYKYEKGYTKWQINKMIKILNRVA